MKKTNVVEDVLKVISEEAGSTGGTQIRVVKWKITSSKGENVSQPFLEKRQFRLQKDGAKYFSRAKGFTKKDLNIISEQWEVIAESMGG